MNTPCEYVENFTPSANLTDTSRSEIESDPANSPDQISEGDTNSINPIATEGSTTTERDDDGLNHNEDNNDNNEPTFIEVWLTKL